MYAAASYNNTYTHAYTQLSDEDEKDGSTAKRRRETGGARSPGTGTGGAGGDLSEKDRKAIEDQDEEDVRPHHRYSAQCILLCVQWCSVHFVVLLQQ